MMRIALGAAVVGAAVWGLYSQGLLTRTAPPASETASSSTAPARTEVAASLKKAVRDDTAPAVSVVRASVTRIRDIALVTGTLVPRLEVLVAPEVEGLRITELLVEEGDRVTKGQTLARLEQETLRATLAQNDAQRAKANAAITQAQSNIVAAEAKRVEASNAYERARPLSKSGVLADSTLDQREAAARTAEAQLKVANDGLKVAEAELAQVDAMRRDILWKLSRTEIQAPVAGIISRRNGRIGAVASGSAVAQPMFNLISNNDIELEAEVPETDMLRLKAGQKASISVAGSSEVPGTVRLVMPEVDKATRLGRVRISVTDGPQLRIGSFARGTVLVRDSEALTLPASAVLFGVDGAYVQLVAGTRISTRKVTPGLQTSSAVEIIAGLQPGDLVVSKAGTFLRDGDIIAPVEPRNGLAKVY